MKLKKKNNKNKDIKKYETISGLNSKTASIYITSISVFLGIVIFATIPFVSNRLNKPITSSILNVVPSGMILGFFIVDKNFDIYFKSLILSPLFNIILDSIIFIMYKYLNISAIISITTGIVIWLIILILSYIYT
jgi:hypothetical protein